MCLSQALIHGDFHTGSVMVTEDSSFVIDPEFAFYGPIGFDVGALVGNFLLAFFSQDGHPPKEEEEESGGGGGDSTSSAQEYKAMILNQTKEILGGFLSKFKGVWDEDYNQKKQEESVVGTSTHPHQFFVSQDEQFEACQVDYLERISSDSIGFAGCKMIRRILGIAHVEDLDSIQDENIRSECEKKALRCAREMVVNANTLCANNFNSLWELVEKS